MKTEQEKKEATEREKVIKAEHEEARKEVMREFARATKEEWDLYTAIWYPAKARWEAFSKPFKEAERAGFLAVDKVEFEALCETRCDWKVCPKCGASGNRYQSHCSVLIGNRECGASLRGAYGEPDPDA